MPSQKRVITLKKYHNSTVLTFDYDKIIDGSQNIILNPFDEVQILKNKSNNFNNYVSIKGEINSEGIGRLYAGDFMFMPWDVDDDICITPSVATKMTVEYMVFS